MSTDNPPADDLAAVESCKQSYEKICQELEAVSMRRRDPAHVRLARAGGWREEMAPKMARACQRQLVPMLRLLGYPEGEEEQSLPRVHSHFQEWTDAILGNGKTFSPFEFGGHLTEIGLSGIVALRLQRNLEWDGEAMEAKGTPEADALVRKQNRTRWL